MIGVIDYGASNLRSVMHALHHLGVDAHVADHPGGLRGADAIILPGVGAFGAGMEQVRARGFEDPVRRAAADGVPLLGICLGAQVLARGFGAQNRLGATPEFGWRTRYGTEVKCALILVIVGCAWK